MCIIESFKITCIQCSNVLNPKTDHISPRYHLVYDDDFTTVSTETSQDDVMIWEGLEKAQSKLGLINQLHNKDKFEFNETLPKLNVMGLYTTRSREIVDHVAPRRYLIKTTTNETILLLFPITLFKHLFLINFL